MFSKLKYTDVFLPKVLQPDLSAEAARQPLFQLNLEFKWFGIFLYVLYITTNLSMLKI